MNVGELKQMLTQYPDDLDIVNERFSDWAIIQAVDWSIVTGVDKNGWVMRSHPTMSEANQAKEKTYLHLYGN